MKRYLYFILILVSLFVGSRVTLAATDNDFMVWTELKYAHPIKNSPFSFHWSTENRFDQDASRYQLFNTTVGFFYKVNKWFKTGMFYRFEKERGKPHENRPMPQAILSAKYGPMKFEGRNRFEFRIFPDEFRFRYRLRIKLGPKYKVGKVSFNPFVANEFFFETKKKNAGFNQDRLSAGLTLGFLKDKIKFTPYYLLRLDKKDEWIKRHVFGTSLALKF